MKCPECNYENDAESNFCINCGSKLKINEQDDVKTIDYQYTPVNVSLEPSFEKYDKIFSENNFTIGQINKIKTFIKENNDEESIDKLIQEENSNNKNRDELSDDEYESLLEFSKKIMIDELNADGVPFLQDRGSKTVTRTQMRTVTEEVPVVKQKHGALTKGAATLGFGLIGLAGTSGVKTEMESIEKQVPIQVQKTVNDIIEVKLIVKDDRLEIKHKDLKEIVNFNQIDNISQENRYIYVKTDKEMITLKKVNKYFSELLTKSLSENIYYLKNYKAIKNKYADKFFTDLNEVWISEISSFNDQNSNLSEIDKIELIKKYHSLKESGIITEDEFEKKKHELLNM